MLYTCVKGVGERGREGQAGGYGRPGVTSRG